MKLIYFVALSILANVPCFAQSSCDSILVGIYERRFVTSSSRSSSSVLDTLKEYHVGSYSEAQNVAANAGFALPIDAIPVQFKLGYKTDSSKQGTWADGLETYFKNDTTQEMHFTQELQTVNKSVVDAWNNCMVNRKGVIIEPDVDPSDPGNIALLIRYVPQTLPASKVPRLTAIDTNGLQIVTRRSMYMGQQIPYNSQLTVVLTRASGDKQQKHISIKTDMPDAIGSVRLRPVPTPPLETNRPPVIVPNGIDFDGDRIADTYFASGNTLTINLGNGLSISRVVSPDFKGENPGCYWLNGDFNGDGRTDLAFMVLGGVADPGYVHVFFFKEDGSWDGPTQFRFRDRQPDYVATNENGS